MRVVRCKTKENANTRAGEALNALLERFQRHPILLLCSGGSSLETLQGVRGEALGTHVTISVLDERYSKDSSINNFAQLSETNFFKRAEGQKCQCIDTRVREEETLEQFARRFENGLRSWKSQHEEGTIIITQGIGKDGHTAGIFPFPEDPKKFQELFENKEVLSVRYNAAGKTEYPERVTVTFPFLRQVDHSVVFVVGEEKRNALERVLAKEGALHETPARIVHEMREVLIFTDII